MNLDKNKIDFERLEKLQKEVLSILSCAPEEYECIEVENDMYADMQNLSESIKMVLDVKAKMLTKQEAVRLHRKMWNCIADEMERTGKIVNKDDYFLAVDIKDQPRYGCYCCEYDARKQKNWYDDRCQYCPLDWESECNRWMCLHKKELGDNEGLYGRWMRAESVKERVELARKIANLRER